VAGRYVITCMNIQSPRAGSAVGARSVSDAVTKVVVSAFVSFAAVCERAV